MKDLLRFIHASRQLVHAPRGLKALQAVAEALQHIFSIDAGVFIFARREIAPGGELGPPLVRVTWGVYDGHVEDIQRSLDDGGWERVLHSDDLRHWYPVNGQSQRQEALAAMYPADAHSVRHFGIWPLQSLDRFTGLMVLASGHQSVPSDDVMEACAAQISFLMDLIYARRVAEDVSMRDFLTGVCNRRGMEEGLDARLRRGGDIRHMGLAVVDLNHFKLVNDQFGHAEGDEILKQVAHILSQSAAGSSDGLASRWGGDEFVAWLPLPSDDPLHCADIIRNWFSLPHGCTVSVGCAHYGNDGTDLATLFRAADERLYGSKPYRVRPVG